MKLGNKESSQDWLDVFRDLKKRGLNHPVLGVSDGAPGLIQAFEEAFPHIEAHEIPYGWITIANARAEGILPIPWH